MTHSALVSIVMIFRDAERFIQEAIDSVFAQTYDAWELLLVDDGSTDASRGVAQQVAANSPHRVRYLDHEGHANRGMSVSRNWGVQHARGALVAFLDSDDVWQPSKLQQQVSTLAHHPQVAMVHGTPLYWRSWTGDPQDVGQDQVPELGVPLDSVFDPPTLLLETAPIGTAPVPCPSDVLVRREAVLRHGGFEARFPGAYEDVAFFVKIYLHEAVFVAGTCWTKYRIHDASCMAVAMREGRYQAARLSFLNWFEQYLFTRGLSNTHAWPRLQTRLAPYRQALQSIAVRVDHSPSQLSAEPNPVTVGSAETTISWDTGDGTVGQVWVSEDGGHEKLFVEGVNGSSEVGWINAGSVYEFRLYAGRDRSVLLRHHVVTRLVDPGVGGESFGSLRRLVPVSRFFGADRGKPIDRYYIDRFLSSYAEDIRGHVLEIGESTYTARFGGERVSSIDVLDVTENNSNATIVADLTSDRLPSSTFDCILLLQTLQLIFDVAKAIRMIHRMLKPGGILLATFPGISPRSADQWGDSWYWGFTTMSARQLFGSAFAPERVAVERYGNVLVTTAFLYGLASSELSKGELDYLDDRYETLIGVRAVK